jgi:hypothetical protein
MRGKVNFKAITSQEIPLKAINSNTAITDTFTLAQGLRKWATGKQPWKDSFKMMRRQNFKQEDSLIGFEARDNSLPQ